MSNSDKLALERLAAILKDREEGWDEKEEFEPKDTMIEELIGDEVQQFEFAKKMFEEANAKLEEAAQIFQKAEDKYHKARNKYKREFSSLNQKIYSDNEVEAAKALARARELKKRWNF